MTNSSSYDVGNRVSVIIPTYNYDRFIGPCIESVLSQDVRDLEIIVVDDGSTDNTADVVRPFMHRIKYLYQQNAGPSAARNTGISNSTGEWLLFLDSDDLLGPNLISSQLRFLQESPGVFVSVVKHETIDDTVSEGNPRSLPSLWTAWRDNLDVHICYFNIAQLGTIMFHRKVISAAGGFDTSLAVCEDYDILLRIIEKGFVPRFNPRGVVYYRKHLSSLTQNMAKMYCHDKIMHLRLAAVLDRNPLFPMGRRLEGLLAFSAGTLLTAGRLDRLNVEGTLELLELVLAKLEEASCVAKEGNKRSNMLTRLFLLRIVSHCALLQSSRGKDKEAIREYVRLIRNTIGAPTSNFRNMIDLLKSSLGPPFDFPEERREIRARIRNSFRWSRLRRLFAEGVA